MSRPDRLHVHVLSDDDRIRQAARALPGRYQVSFSSNRREALEAIQWRGDVAVIELELGGFDLAKQIGERIPDRDIRIVMLCDRPHDRWLSKQAGAGEVIVKPLIDTTTLHEAVERVVADLKTGV